MAVETARSAGFRQDPNGFLFGADDRPRQLVVGVGDTVEKLRLRNPALAGLKLTQDQPLRLPLLASFDLQYDDGDVRLAVGGVADISIDGTVRFPGAASVGTTLRERPADDWKRALELAAELDRRLLTENKQLQDLRAFFKGASPEELRAVGGRSLRREDNDLGRFVTLEEAAARFAKDEKAAREAAVPARQSGTALVGLYGGRYALIIIGVSRVTRFGGSNLTDAEQRSMRYDVDMLFRLREDVEPPGESRAEGRNG